LSYNLTKQTLNLSYSSQLPMIAAAFGETCACLVRVPTEVIKQRAQVNRNLRLSTIARSCLRNEGLSGLYRGYFATLAREIPFSMIQYPLWEFFKVCFVKLYERKNNADDGPLPIITEPTPEYKDENKSLP
ncbi:unnamed protein product, partial [Rotaria sp. Silwood1]